MVVTVVVPIFCNYGYFLYRVLQRFTNFSEFLSQGQEFLFQGFYKE